MSDLISRSEAIEALDQHSYENGSDYAKTVELLNDLPAIDAVPVVHARWIRDELGNTRCSNCHTRLPFRHCYDDEDGYEWDDEIDETTWCMHCGARMDGEAE